MFHLKKNQIFIGLPRVHQEINQKVSSCKKINIKHVKCHSPVFVKPVLNKIHIDNRISQWHTFKVKQKTL